MNKLKHQQLYYGFALVAIIMMTAASQYMLFLSKHLNVFMALDNGSLGYLSVMQFSLMFVAMLVVWRLSCSQMRLLEKSNEEKIFGDSAYFKAILITAVVARLLLIGTEPYLSNDVARYLFDGVIVYSGFDPYTLAHNSPILAELYEQWQPPAEHAKYATLYPPLALALFTLAAATGLEYALLTWQLMVLVASLLTLYLSVLMLKKAGKLQHIALVALSPLLILESGLGLHLDSFTTLAIVAAVYVLQLKRYALVGILIGLGTSIKILPLMLLLPLFFYCRFKAALTIVLACFITIAVVYGTTLVMGYQAIGVIGVFFEKWRFAAPLYKLVESVFSGQALLIALMFMSVSIAAVIALLSFFNRQKNSQILYLCLQASVALPLLLSPVLFPWYLSALVPLIALRPHFYTLAWLAVLPLTYEVLNQFYCCQIWQPATWPMVVIALLYMAFLSHLLAKLFKFLLVSKKTNTAIPVSNPNSLAVNNSGKNSLIAQAEA